MKKKIIILCVSIVVLIIAIPLGIDWLIIGNSFPSNIDNHDWVGFLGGYVGAIIGAIFSFIGIIITIRYTRMENRHDRELQIRPFCLISTCNTLPEEILANLYFHYSTEQESCVFNYDTVSKKRIILEIKNIGIGPAINCKLKQNSILTYCFNNSNESIDTHKHEELLFNCINSEKSIYIPYTITYLPPNNDRKAIWGESIDECANNLWRLYPKCILHFTFEYTDFIQTKYEQDFSLEISFNTAFTPSFTIAEDITCNLRLNNCSIPRQVNQK